MGSHLASLPFGNTARIVGLLVAERVETGRVLLFSVPFEASVPCSAAMRQQFATTGKRDATWQSLHTGIGRIRTYCLVPPVERLSGRVIVDDWVRYSSPMSTPQDAVRGQASARAGRGTRRERLEFGHPLANELAVRILVADLLAGVVQPKGRFADQPTLGLPLRVVDRRRGVDEMVVKPVRADPPRLLEEVVVD